jgi:hypothetical protein
LEAAAAGACAPAAPACGVAALAGVFEQAQSQMAAAIT